MSTKNIEVSIIVCCSYIYRNNDRSLDWRKSYQFLILYDEEKTYDIVENGDHPSNQYVSVSIRDLYLLNFTE
jgi:hypothetical protein